MQRLQHLFETVSDDPGVGYDVPLVFIGSFIVALAAFLSTAAEGSGFFGLDWVLSIVVAWVAATCYLMGKALFYTRKFDALARRTRLRSGR